MALVTELRQQLDDIRDAVKRTTNGVFSARDICRRMPGMETLLDDVCDDALEAYNKVVKLQNDL